MSSHSREGSETIPSDPLAFEGGALELRFEEYALDGDDEYFELDSAGDTVTLTEWEGDWNTLSLRGEVAIETELTENVFPPDERDDPPGRLVLAVDCDATHLREGHPIGVDNFSSGTRPVELTVSAKDHFGAFDVTPYLVRTDDGGESSTYRSVAGVALADGESVTVEIDERAEGDDRLLPAHFKSFGDTDSPQFPDDAVYVVDKQDRSRPKLFVNSDHEPIRDTLNSGPRGYIGHVMMVYRDLVFLPALSELVVWTAQEVDEDGSTPHEWQEALLAQIGTKMYDVADATGAGERMYEEFHVEESAPTFLDKTTETLEEYLEIEDSMNALVETLRS